MKNPTDLIRQNFPCENCITLPICKSKEKNYGYVAKIHDLCCICYKIKNYVDVVDIPGENDPSDVNTPCPLQGKRMMYIMEFMGWRKWKNSLVTITAEQKTKRVYVGGASHIKRKILKLARSFYVGSKNQ